jgi:hypothetical protein
MILEPAPIIMILTAIVVITFIGSGIKEKRMKLLRKGISELVAILIIVVIAVVAGLAIRSWLSAQMSKTPTTEMSTAEWSAIYTGTQWIITINVRNNLDRALIINATRVIFQDGSVQGIGSFSSASFSGLTVKSPSTPPPYTVSPKSSFSIIVTYATGASNPPKICEVAVTDTATRANGWVQAVGGPQA